MSKPNNETAPVQRRKGSGKYGNGNPDKIKDQGFDKYPERINRNGRPKLLRQINDDLQSQGIEKATISQIVDNYSYLMNCTETKLKSIKDDPNSPYLLRKLIQTMSTEKFLEVLEMIMNRSFGRTKQHIEISEADAPEPDNATPDQAELLVKVQARLADIDKKDEEIVPGE